MKRSLILVALVLAIVALPFEATVQAQAPPTFVGAGALFRNGGPTEFAMQTGANINFMRGTQDSGQGYTSQIYGSARLFYADDVGLDTAIAQQLEALSGYGIYEITCRKFFGAIGVGLMMEPQEGENPVAGAVLLEGGWKPISPVRITLGTQYIPITGMGDLVFVYGGLGIRF